jgi:hypothetical protein
MADVEGDRVRPAGAETCRWRYQEEGADDAKQSFNQSNHVGRSEDGNTYMARSLGGWFHTKRLDLGRRSLLGDDIVGHLGGVGRATNLSADGKVVLLPALVEFGTGEILVFLFIDHSTRLENLDQTGIHDDQKDVCVCGQRETATVCQWTQPNEQERPTWKEGSNSVKVRAIE